MRITVKNTGISNKAMLLKNLLEIEGIFGLEGAISPTVTYDDTYFKQVEDAATPAYITVADEHPYKEELENLLKIDFDLHGDWLEAPVNVKISTKASKLGLLLHNSGNTPMLMDVVHGVKEYNSMYFTLDKDTLHVKEEFLNIMELKHGSNRR